MLTRENSNRNWTPENIKDLHAMIEEGLTSADIAHKTGRSICAIESKRKKLGMIKKSRPTLWTQEEFDQLGVLLKDGLTDDQIASRMGRGATSVYQHRRRLYPEVRPRALRPFVRPIHRGIKASEVLSQRPLAPHDLDYSRRAYATTAFLISLLRAGHKPGQGEFAIPSEARVVRPSDLVGA